MRPQTSHFGRGLLDNFTNAKYQGEQHSLSFDPRHMGQVYNYVGPGTRLDIRLDENLKPKHNEEPLNKLDKISLTHDLAYLKAGNAYKQNPTPQNKKAQMDKVWAADDEFIKEAKAQTDDRVIGKIASTMIKAKETGEKLGVLPSKTFSGFGKKPMKQDPTRKLKLQILKQSKKSKRKHKRKSKRGGFAFLASLVL